MVGKAFAWKACNRLSIKTLTADMERLFQRGMSTVKNGDLYALVRANLRFVLIYEGGWSDCSFYSSFYSWTLFSKLSSEAMIFAVMNAIFAIA